MNSAYLDVLSRAGATNAPVPATRLRDWMARLGAPLPAALVGAYETTDGSSGAEALAMRLLRSDEVLEVTEELRGGIGSEVPEGLFAFWADEYGNYAAVFIAGPLEGMVVFVDHEEPLFVPRYGSVESFLARLVEVSPDAWDWYRMVHEYPRRVPTTASRAAREETLKEQFVARCRADPRDAWAAHVAMQFFTRADVELTRAFLTGPDRRLHERACYVVGDLEMHELTDELERVGHADLSNARIASIVALKKLRTEPSRAALTRLSSALGPGYQPYFR